MCKFIATEHDCGHKTYRVPPVDSGDRCAKVFTSPSTNEPDCSRLHHRTLSISLRYSVCTRVRDSTCRHHQCYWDWYAGLGATFSHLSCMYRKLARRFYEFPIPAWTRIDTLEIMQLWEEFGPGALRIEAGQLATRPLFLQSWSLLKQYQVDARELLPYIVDSELSDAEKDMLDLHVTTISAAMEISQLHISHLARIMEDCWRSCRSFEEARGYPFSEREDSIRMRWNWAKRWHDLLHRLWGNPYPGHGDLCGPVKPGEWTLVHCFERAMGTARSEDTEEDEMFTGYDAWWLTRRPTRQGEYDEVELDHILYEGHRDEMGREVITSDDIDNDQSGIEDEIGVYDNTEASEWYQQTNIA